MFSFLGVWIGRDLLAECMGRVMRMRWNVIGLSGLALAAVGIAVTVWLNERSERLAHIAACNEASLAVSQAGEVNDAAGTELAHFEERLQTADNRLEDAEALISQARRYFEALDGELVASRVHSQFVAALEEVDEQYGAGASENLTADDWFDALDNAGYPRAFADRQLIARQLSRFALEEGAARALVLPSRDRDVIERVIEELAEVSWNGAAARDRFFRPEFQGVVNAENFIVELREALARAQTERDTIAVDLEEARSELRRADTDLGGAVSRFEALNCEA